MKKIIALIFLYIFTFACTPAPTPKIIVITVVVQPTSQLIPTTPTPTLIPSTPTVTPNPCLRWDQITLGMVGQTICVRGIIRNITLYVQAKRWQSHWDFTDNRTGFFATSSYLGWHTITGKDMSVGDCVAITGKIQILSNSRPYIYWGTNSIYKSTLKNGVNQSYYEHPDLQIIENNPSFCQ